MKRMIQMLTVVGAVVMLAAAASAAQGTPAAQDLSGKWTMKVSGGPPGEGSDGHREGDRDAAGGGDRHPYLIGVGRGRVGELPEHPPQPGADEIAVSGIGRAGDRRAQLRDLPIDGVVHPQTDPALRLDHRDGGCGGGSHRCDP